MDTWGQSEPAPLPLTYRVGGARTTSTFVSIMAVVIGGIGVATLLDRDPRGAFEGVLAMLLSAGLIVTVLHFVTQITLEPDYLKLKRNLGSNRIPYAEISRMEIRYRRQDTVCVISHWGATRFFVSLATDKARTALDQLMVTIAHHAGLTPQGLSSAGLPVYRRPVRLD